MRDRQDELIEKLDLTQLSKTASGADVGQFDQLVYLLDVVGDRQDELIEKLDLTQLSKTASSADVGQFAQLAHLLDTAGDRQDDVIKNLDLVQLAKKCKDIATTKQFKQLAYLLNAVGSFKAELIEKLDFERLAQVANTPKIGDFRFRAIAILLDTFDMRKKDLIVLLDYDVLIERANQVDRDDIMGLTMFISQLDEERRNVFIRQIDWVPICMKCPIHVGLLKALGTCLENLWKKAELVSKDVTFNKVVQHLRENAKEIKQEIEKANPKRYSGVAKFLWNCNRIDHSLATEIAINIMGKLVESFRIRPENYRGIGELINAFRDIDPVSSELFLGNNRVRGRIQQSINEHDWNEKTDDLKYLIKAFYRSFPKLWKKMVNDWIVVNLNSLDLDSIYKDVNEEKDIP